MQTADKDGDNDRSARGASPLVIRAQHASIAEGLDFLERSARRLLNIAKIDGPPVLIEREAEFILRRITEIRTSLSKVGA